jgi:hypothetical protein
LSIHIRLISVKSDFFGENRKRQLLVNCTYFSTQNTLHVIHQLCDELFSPKSILFLTVKTEKESFAKYYYSDKNRDQKSHFSGFFLFLFKKETFQQHTRESQFSEVVKNIFTQCIF